MGSYPQDKIRPFTVAMRGRTSEMVTVDLAGELDREAGPAVERVVADVLTDRPRTGITRGV